METIVANVTGKYSVATLHGREYYVVPLTSIVPGILNGSKGALFYSSELVGRKPQVWDGMPVVLRHPIVNGRPATARRPDVLESSGLGWLFDSEFGGKLAHNAWIDKLLVRQRDLALPESHRVEPRILRGEKIELSTGLFTWDVPARNGASHDGRPYDFAVEDYQPDHLAILPDEVGACSVRDGCGVFNSAATEPDEKRTLWQRLGDLLGVTAAAAKSEPSPAATLVAPEPTDAEKEAAMNKAQIVDWLVANCSCWKGQGDKETLNKLPDDKLAALKAAAEKAKADAVVANAAGKPQTLPDGSTLAWDAAKGAWEVKPKPAEVPVAKPVTNETRLTAEEAEDLAFARAERTRQKQAMIDRLTANVADAGQKAAAQAVYAGMKAEQLAPLVAALPPAPAQQDQQQPPQAYWGGAVPPPPVTANVKDDSDNLLPQEVTDFEQYASPALRRKAAQQAA